ncbi:MAG: T9SS type A sorting domain-containing protein [Saprospiraceae bacterium]|nr:T9SS type A sorting domain-containing protein [Saprospiraceae bacterium]
MKNPPVFRLALNLFFTFSISFFFSNFNACDAQVDSLKLTFNECSGGSYKVNNECVLDRLQLSKTVRYESDKICSQGTLKWRVIIDMWADSLPDYEYNSQLPTDNDIDNVSSNNWNLIKDDNADGIPDIYLKTTAMSSMAFITLPRIEGRKSNHILTWEVTDDCGTVIKCSEVIEVLDKKAPTPVCIPLTSLHMQDPDGSGPWLPMAELWAIDFMNKAYDNCTEDDDLLFTFDNVVPQVENKVLPGGVQNVINIDVPHYFNTSGGLAPYPVRPNNESDKAIQDKYLRGEDGIQLWSPVTRSSAKVWTINNFLSGTDRADFDVSVSVWDRLFNSDYCWTVINPGCTIGCNLPELLEGTVKSIDDKVVSDADIELIVFNSQPYSLLLVTNENGKFNVSSNLDNYQFSLKANYKFKAMCGLDYGDFATLLAHIHKTKFIDNPYKLYAADINDDGQINIKDAGLLFNALNSNEEIGFGSSIVAVKDSTINKSNWHEKITSSKIDSMQYRAYYYQDFIAIKKGDINGNFANFKNIKEENFLNSINTIIIAPNPFVDYGTLSYSSDSDQDIILSIYHISGSLISSIRLPSKKGYNYKLLDAHDFGPSGEYIIEIKEESGAIETIKVLKL